MARRRVLHEASLGNSTRAAALDRLPALHAAHRQVALETRVACYSQGVKANEAKCLVVSKVLVADGMMGDGEREFLAELMERLGLTDEERHRVTQLEGLDAADAVVRALPIDER